MLVLPLPVMPCKSLVLVWIEFSLVMADFWAAFKGGVLVLAGLVWLVVGSGFIGRRFFWMPGGKMRLAIWGSGVW